MGILDEVTQMKHQGMSDEDIISGLRERGYSPKQINEGLNQAQIKDAVYNENQPGEENMNEQGGSAPAPSSKNIYTPQTKEIPEQEAYSPQQYQEQKSYPQQGYPQQDYYQSEGYDYNQGQTYQGSYNTDNIIEIAEQVFSEKIKKLQKKQSELNEFKTLSQGKIENALERIKRIETIMDKLQAAILEKIGSYGSTLQSIKKEMSMMQDSFRKVASSKKSNASATHPKKTHKKTSKKK